MLTKKENRKLKQQTRNKATSHESETEPGQSAKGFHAHKMVARTAGARGWKQTGVYTSLVQNPVTSL